MVEPIRTVNVECMLNGSPGRAGRIASVLLRSSHGLSRIGLATFFVLRVGALFAADLSIPSDVTQSGSNVIVGVGYHALGAAAVGLQFDLKYDHSAFTVTATSGPATASAGKTLTTSVLQNGMTRFLIAGINGNVIPDGNVVMLAVQIVSNAFLRGATLTILDASGADPAAHAVPIRVHSESFVRPGPVRVKLD